MLMPSESKIKRDRIEQSDAYFSRYLYDKKAKQQDIEMTKKNIVDFSRGREEMLKKLRNHESEAYYIQKKIDEIDKELRRLKIQLAELLR